MVAPGAFGAVSVAVRDFYMILRITAQLGKKLGFTPSQVLPMDTNPFTDWTAHLFRADRTRYILLTNTATLYSGVMYGRGITDYSDFLKWATFTMIDTLRRDGFGFIAEGLIAPNAHKALMSKSLNRTVTGSINCSSYDLIRHQSSERGPTVRSDRSYYDLSRS